MTERPANWWRLPYAAAVLAAAAGAGCAWGLYTAGTARPGAAAIPLPAVGLAVATFLVRRAGRPLRAVAGAAVGYALAVNILFLLGVYRRRLGDDLVPAWLVLRGDDELFLLAEFPLAAAVGVACVVGRWRRDRLADPDADA